MKSKKQKVSAGVVGETPFISLEETLAKREFDKFGASDKTEYSQKIEKMAESELFHHATNMGLRPSGNKKLLILNLNNLFAEAKSRYAKFKGDNCVSDSSASKYAQESYDIFMNTFRSR